MTAITLEKPKATLTFPITEVEAVLRRELLASVEFEASIRGVSIPKTPTEVARLAIDIDSLVVVDILCAVEPVLGFELREGLVRAGGYRSVESALGHIVPWIEREWTKLKGAKA